MGGSEGEAVDPVGPALALELLNAIQEANKNAAATREVLIELRDLLEEGAKGAKIQEALLEATDELCGRLEVLSIAAGIVSDVHGNGKRVDIGDVMHAISTATTDVFPEDGDEDEDEGDEDGGDEDEPDADPVLPGGGRKRGRRIS